MLNDDVAVAVVVVLVVAVVVVVVVRKESNMEVEFSNTISPLNPYF